MIPLAASLSVRYVPLDTIRYPIDGHWPHHLDIAQIQHYATLLQDNPESSTDPIVLHDNGTHYTIANGRHRFLAHCVAGRTHIAAVVVQVDEV